MRYWQELELDAYKVVFVHHLITAGVSEVPLWSVSADIGQSEALENGIKGSESFSTAHVSKPEDNFADDSLLSMVCYNNVGFSSLDTWGFWLFRLQSFLETLQDEMKDQLRDDSPIFSGQLYLGSGDNVSLPKVLSSNPNSPSKKFRYAEPESNDLNHVCMLDDLADDDFSN